MSDQIEAGQIEAGVYPTCHASHVGAVRDAEEGWLDLKHGLNDPLTSIQPALRKAFM
jgi:hypothetical protein